MSTTIFEELFSGTFEGITIGGGAFGAADSLAGGHALEGRLECGVGREV